VDPNTYLFPPVIPIHWQCQKGMGLVNKNEIKIVSTSKDGSSNALVSAAVVDASSADIKNDKDIQDDKEKLTVSIKEDGYISYFFHILSDYLWLLLILFTLIGFILLNYYLKRDYRYSSTSRSNSSGSNTRRTTRRTTVNNNVRNTNILGDRDGGRQRNEYSELSSQSQNKNIVSGGVNNSANTNNTSFIRQTTLTDKVHPIHHPKAGKHPIHHPKPKHPIHQSKAAKHPITHPKAKHIPKATNHAPKAKHHPKAKAKHHPKEGSHTSSLKTYNYHDHPLSSPKDSNHHIQHENPLSSPRLSNHHIQQESGIELDSGILSSSVNDHDLLNTPDLSPIIFERSFDEDYIE